MMPNEAEKPAGENLMPSAPRTLDDLIAINSVSQLKARYFRFMDTKQWDLWEALYTTDAVLDASGDGPAMGSLGFPTPPADALVFRTATGIRQAVSAALEGVRTVHHGHMGEFEILGPDRVKAVWAMQDIIRYPVGAPTPIKGFDGFGHYEDHYVRRDDKWLIESVRLTRLVLLPV
jgi:hypothetical protein